jgi:thiamine-monophosphate kinase
MIVSVVMLGEAEKGQVVTRAGAKPGDLIFVTGTLGDSAAGVELLKSGGRGQKSGAGSKDFPPALHTPRSALVRRHLRPVPRIEWGRKIALYGFASAMIDISDGLSSDLSHICSLSRVGAAVYSEKIPLSPSLRKASSHLAKSVIQYALSGGEDYELLFTASPAEMKKILTLDFPVTEIGEITRKPRW